MPLFSRHVALVKQRKPFIRCWRKRGLALCGVVILLTWCYASLTRVRKSLSIRRSNDPNEATLPLTAADSTADWFAQRKTPLPNNNNNNTNNNNNNLTGRRFAYAFVVGGCDPKHPSYRYYLYNILVAAFILQHEATTSSSSSQIIVYVQMAHSSRYNTLLEHEVKWLERMNIQIVYLPKSRVESFYGIVLEKFRILNLTEYQRVLLLDADVMPLMNLDYLMEMSLQGILQENVVIAGRLEPANAGLFVVTPLVGAYDRVRQIIRETQERSDHRPYPDYWDKDVGWGQVMTPPDDYWENYRGERFHKWDFHAAFSDQGLLYQWTKYERQRVSIVFPKGRVQNWGPSTTKVDPTTNRTRVVLKATLENPFVKYAPQAGRRCLRDMRCRGPVLDDHVHFTGRAKPWLEAPPPLPLLTALHDATSKSSSRSASTIVWYQTLYRLNHELDMGIDFTNWTTGQDPPLGYYATPIQAAMVRWDVMWKEKHPAVKKRFDHS